MSPFHTNDPEKLKQEREKSNTTSNVPVLFLDSGATIVRILPTWEEGGVYFKEYREHYLKVDTKSYFITCSRPDDCAVCDEADRLYDLGDDISMELSSNFNPRRVFLFNVVVLDTPPPRVGDPVEKGKVMVLKAGVTVKNDVVKMDQDAHGGFHDLTDPSHGINVRITKEGKGLDTEYTTMPYGERVPIVDYLASIGVNKTADQISDEMFDLNLVYPPRDYDEVAGLVARAKVRDRRQVPTSTPVPTPDPKPTPKPAPVEIKEPKPVAPKQGTPPPDPGSPPPIPGRPASEEV